MKKNHFLKILIILFISLFRSPTMAKAGEVRIAAAANFMEPLKAIADTFEKQTGHKTILTFASTGKIYAQIKNGAPFDIFFAADITRPKLLEEEGLAIAGSRFTYACGELVLWSPKEGYVDNLGKVLEGDFKRLAIANPKLAPYGEAAQNVLEAMGLWKKLQGRMVFGEDIGQIFQFVGSENAQLGFVAYSQIKKEGRGSFWIVPQKLYKPIEQQVVLIKDTPAAREFLKFIKSGESLTIIKNYGYGLKK